MVVDDSKDSATSPIIAQSPQPSAPAPTPRGFSIRRVVNRAIEVGKLHANIFFQFTSLIE